MFSIIDTLNTVFTAIATAYIYLVGAGLIICFVQGIYARHCNATMVSNEHYEQTKAMLTIEPDEPDTKPQGKALVLTVETVTPEVVTDFWAEIDFDSMGIRAIRDYIRTHSLQTVIRDRVGKNVAKCSLKELRVALG